MAKKTSPIIKSVALPLGNPLDLSLRAKQVILDADYVYCEDTRKFRSLLQALDMSLKPGVKIRTIPGSEEWSEDWSKLESDAEGKLVITVSDAGTPIINDPGLALTKYAREQGWSFEALPGPCAPVLTIQATGGFGLPFSFYGFAPKDGADSKAFKGFVSAVDQVNTFVFFDTRYQIVNTLEKLAASNLADRSIHLTRELTKTYEEIFSGSVSEVLERVKAKLQKDDALGELTIVLEGRPSDSLSQSTTLTIEELLEFRNAAPRKAAKILSQAKGLSSQESYKLIVESRP